MNTLARDSMLGVLGGGQLGRMFVLAAHDLGYRVSALAPAAGSPAGQVADVEIVGDASDPETVFEFARSVQAVTCENELVPANVLEYAAEAGPVRPSAAVIRTTQDRIVQRQLLELLGVACAPYRALRSPGGASSLPAALFPAMLKSARGTYDGRGQRVVTSPAELAAAWDAFGGTAALLERHVDLDAEFSVIVARSASGQVVTYEPIKNVHVNGVLSFSLCPAGLADSVVREASDITRRVADHLGLEGVLCIEFFLDRRGAVLVNEIAGRPHNSGHLTIEAFATSQFEQQVRVLAGLPLGEARRESAAAMVNLFDGAPYGGPPVREAASGIYVHNYGKSARPGRKSGHITSLAADAPAALRRAFEAAASVHTDLRQ